MREILFRGLRKDGKGWVEGYLIGDDVIVGEVAEFTDEYINLWYHYKVHPHTVGQFTGLYDATKWQDATEEQRKYAYDLARKNNTTPQSEWKGVRIFEGDIVFNSNKTLLTHHEDKRIYLVKWQDGEYTETDGTVWLSKKPSFVFEKINPDGKNYMSLIFSQQQIKVIGKIHESEVQGE